MKKHFSHVFVFVLTKYIRLNISFDRWKEDTRIFISNTFKSNNFLNFFHPPILSGNARKYSKKCTKKSVFVLVTC